jgi:hypothetical protein
MLEGGAGGAWKFQTATEFSHRLAPEPGFGSFGGIHGFIEAGARVVFNFQRATLGFGFQNSRTKGLIRLRVSRAVDGQQTLHPGESHKAMCETGSLQSL